MTHHPPTLHEQLPQIRRWSTLVLTTAALTLLGGWAFGAWSLPKMASYVSGNFEVDDGTRERDGSWLPEWRGRRGPRLCPGCRTRREMHVQDGVARVLSEERVPVARWVLERLPAHVHRWDDVDCWTSVTERPDGQCSVVNAMRASPANVVGDELWWRFLRAHTDELQRRVLNAALDEPALATRHADELRSLVLTATLGGPEAAALAERVRAWDAEGRDASGLTRDEPAASVPASDDH